MDGKKGLQGSDTLLLKKFALCKRPPYSVIPAKAGIHLFVTSSRRRKFCGSDEEERNDILEVETLNSTSNKKPPQGQRSLHAKYGGLTSLLTLEDGP